MGNHQFLLRLNAETAEWPSSPCIRDLCHSSLRQLIGSLVPDAVVEDVPGRGPGTRRVTVLIVVHDHPDILPRPVDRRGGSTCSLGVPVVVEVPLVAIVVGDLAESHLLRLATVYHERPPTGAR